MELHRGAIAAQVTGENSEIVKTDYTDPNFWRPADVYDQANNETLISYSGQTAVETALQNFNGGNSVSDFRTTVDGFGRPILSQRLQAPGANYDTAETDYDNLGQPYRTTMPFSAASGGTSSTAPGTNTTYDALGRVLTMTDANLGSVSYSYTNNDVLQQVSGPSGTQTFQKQSEYDGLGRLISVCEISATLPGVGACGQGVSQMDT
jgi:YD repeat-containing protein